MGVCACKCWMTTKAIPESAAMCLKKSMRACSPPADEPRQIIFVGAMMGSLYHGAARDRMIGRTGVISLPEVQGALVAGIII